MFTTGRKVDAFLWDHVTAMSYSLFRGYIALFIIPDFLTPNIHFSFPFKPRYSLFIIQLPPPETLLLLSPSLALRPKSGAYLIHLNRGQTDGHFFSGAPRKQSPVAKKI